jgi:mono/diheme cytochrome c family protein
MEVTYTMSRSRFATAALTFSAVALTGLIATASGSVEPPASSSGGVPPAGAARGKYLVAAMGCNDCHTPWQLGPRGPEPDMTRALTGHPQDLVMPPAPAPPQGPWGGMVGGVTNTAFAGPWGVNFSANLTPDKETGLGDWTVEQFIATIRTQRHQGKGRPVLPPMPAQMFANLNDEDLSSIFAYLQSLPPVKNRVPQPIDPPETTQQQ